jgi:hypothetical protein
MVTHIHRKTLATIRVDEPPEDDVAAGGDAHAPGEDAPALDAPAEPYRDELPEHVGDEIDRPRPGDLDVVEAELVLQRMLDDRVDLAGEVEAGIGEPGRREELHAIPAQQRGIAVHAYSWPLSSSVPSAMRAQKRGGRLR